MAMLTKTLDDILVMTNKYHRALACSLDENAHQVKSERCSLLLNYLANQESKLSKKLNHIRHGIGEKELNTWFYEYSDRHAVIHSNPYNLPFREMAIDEIQETISSIHNDLIDLYTHLCERAENNTVQENLQNLVMMYQSTTEQISFGAESVNEM